MKISKLFHWLYAFLMLLPVFAVGVKCGYVMFNKNSFDSYSGAFTFESVQPLSQLNPVTTDDVTSLGNSYFKVYSADIMNTTYVNYVSGVPGWVCFNVDIQKMPIKYVFERMNINYSNIHSIFLRTEYFAFSSRIITDSSSPLLPSFIYSVAPDSPDFTYFENMEVSLTEPYLYVVSSFGVNAVPNRVNNNFSCLSYITDTNLSAVFYSSVQELDRVPFFSWARNSFIAQPFMYIGNLFGVPDVHPIFTFMSYWLAISIIWLVFDLFMYVPLLCHRWLDKGVIE